MQPPTLQKEFPQVSFLGIYRTTTPPNNFLAATLLWSYSCKKCNKPLLQIGGTKILDEKRFIKNFFKVNKINNSGVVRIYQIMSKLQTINQTSAVKLLANTAVLWIVTSNFEPAEHFYISHFACHLRYIIIDHSWKLLTIKINRMTRSEKMMENKNQIDIKFW